MLGVVHRNR